jgi:two-component system, chemotaxis family, CheB/CheR fusion protein
MNEELETAKEELQSTNEELTTVNDELHSRNQEMNVLNNDLINLLGTVDVPILILDPQLRIRRFTPKSRSILNIVPSDTGRPIGDIKPNIDVPDLEQQVAEVIREVKVKESEVQDREGRWYRMQIRPYLAADERVDGAVLSLVDIDALKHHVSEAQLARAEAERANRAKDQFLATLSHELRTPLSTMLIHAQRLAAGAVDADQVRTTGQAIERGTRLQVQLIDDLLDVSRIVSGKLKMRWRAVSLVEVIRSALESVNAQAERKDIRFKVTLAEDVDPVYGDATRLQQVFWNLLNNAIKFSAQGGEVIVKLETERGQAHVQVGDQGVGIEPAFLPHVWNHFTQEDNSNTRGYGGLGLGLAIVHHLVQVHGGTVSAESAGKNKGATFRVTIPVAGAHLHHPGAEESPPLPPGSGSSHGNGGDTRRLRGLKILLVDDDAGLREAVAASLGGTGAVVRSAGSAAEALAAVTEFAPDILLSDIAMPGEDGYSLIRRVRALGAEHGGDVPAIALTALAGDNDRQRVLAAGFQSYVSKPVDLDQLAKALLGQVPIGSPRAPVAPPGR